MRMRMKRRRRHWKFKATLVLVLLLFFIVQSLYFIEGSLRPMLMVIARTMAQQYATQAINDAITKKIADETNYADLIKVISDSNGKVISAHFNFSEGARIQSQATYRVQKVLADFGKNGAQIKLPIGQVLNSAILAHYGPVIPVTITPYGTVYSQILADSKELGINQTVHILYLLIRTSVSVIVPFVSEPAVVETRIPIAYVMFVGNVPQTFYDARRDPMNPLTLGGIGGTDGSLHTDGSVDLTKPVQ